MMEKTLNEITEEIAKCSIEKHQSEDRLKALINEGRYSDARNELVSHDDIFRRYIALKNEYHKKYYGEEEEWPDDLWRIPPEYRIPDGSDRVKGQMELF